MGEKIIPDTHFGCFFKTTGDRLVEIDKISQYK